jgi:hypothetical protein
MKFVKSRLHVIGGGFGRLATALLIISCVSSTATAQNYLTNFAKDNDIFTNLNQQFPNTGPGTPGSGIGTANSSFLFDPSASAVVAGGYAPNYLVGSNQVNNGINFALTSNSAGQDFAQIGPVGLPSLTVAAGLNDVSHVYLLMGAYDGTSFNVTFTGAGGATETFNNISLPDFNGGVGNGSINQTGTGYLDQTVFITHDQGAGGSGNSSTGAYNYYDLTEVTFNLDPSLQGQELTSFTITSNGYETLVLGATADGTVPASSSSVPENSSTAALLVTAAAVLLWLRHVSKAGLLTA